jgi:hypothetical protein
MLLIQDLAIKVALEDGDFQLTLSDKDVVTGKQVYHFIEAERKIKASVTLETKNQVMMGSVKVQVENHPFRENYNLRGKAPVKLSIGFEERPIRLCATYQHRDWWSRPEFVSTFDEVPERTQSLFLKGSKNYGYILPMVGNRTKTYLTKGSETRLSLEMTSYCDGLNDINDVCFLLSEGDNLFEIITKVYDVASEIKKVPAKGDRRYPEMFEYFGWCSWDAFYTDITEQKVLQKVEELKDKQVPIRWLLMDDGWLNTKNMCLTTLEPEPVKFPNQFKDMITKIKDDSMINWVGVWHAFAGYWGGIAPESVLAKDFKDYLYQTKTGQLIPHYDPEKGYHFWEAWYQYLSNQGIDFVKVDGQSALKNYYKNNEEIGRVASGSHCSLEKAVNEHMHGNIINCMGMAMENVFNRPSTCISRNSDDFVPNDEKGFREHMLQNTYNALYHDQMYVCDWDMYWTKHPDARKHALVRAISGGPIYVSDPIGETIHEEIMPLVYRDGKILRMDRCAKPSLDCIFESPLTEQALKLTNTIHGTGAIAAFHISELKEVVAELSPSDIYDLEGEQFLAFDYFHRTVQRVNKHDTIAITLNENDYFLYLFLPLQEQVTPIGLINKYMSAHALRECTSIGKQSRVSLVEGGCFAFYKEEAPRYIQVNGIDRTEELVVEEHGLYRIDLSDCTDETTIIIE